VKRFLRRVFPYAVVYFVIVGIIELIRHTVFPIPELPLSIAGYTYWAAVWVRLMWKP